MKIRFLGATQTVTGSKYWLQAGSSTILIDCGLFQGFKPLRLRNWDAIPVKPEDIDAILLTHAHIDHSGYIPRLIKMGFRGPIYCAEATRDLCAVLLPDSGHLQEEEARYANLKGYSKHHPAKPLYTRTEAELSLEQFKVIKFAKKYRLSDELFFTFHYAGHILGAAGIHLEHEENSIFFSGDLGRTDDPIMKPPSPPAKANYYVIESTYGDRLHDASNPEQALGEIVTRTAKRGGTTLIPAFAVGRTQAILYHLYQLKLKQQIPNLPIFVDSPMATDATQLFYEHSQQHRLSKSLSAEVCKIAQYVRTVDESIAFNSKKVPMIIISASGMATGGRVLHHLKNLAPDHRNTIVFCGFQAGGTRGERLVRGESHTKIFGQEVIVRAEVVEVENLSAHTDANGMIDWLGQLNHHPRQVFITHGEARAAQVLKQRLKEELKWPSTIPNFNQTVTLD
jgi:metallo-beta-lactamase family protein